MKKFLSMALALVMVLGLVPVFVSQVEAGIDKNTGVNYKVTTPPEIDGTINAAEWGDSCYVYTGFSDTYIGKPTKMEFWMVYDANTYYFAYKIHATDFVFGENGTRLLPGMNFNGDLTTDGSKDEPFNDSAYLGPVSINEGGTTFSVSGSVKDQCSINAKYENGVASYEFAVPASLLSRTPATAGTVIRFGAGLYYTKDGGSVTFGGFSATNTLSAVLLQDVIRSVPQTTTTPAIDGNITSMEWGLPEWYVNDAAVGIFEAKYGQVGDNRAFGYDYKGGNVRNLSDIAYNCAYDANNVYFAVTITEPNPYTNANGDLTVASRKLEFFTNTNSSVFNITFDGQTCTSSTTDITVGYTSNEAKNVHNFEIAIPLKVIRTDLTAGSVFSGAFRYLVKAQNADGAGDVVTNSCADIWNSHGNVVKQYRQRDQFYLGTIAQAETSAPVSSNLYNEHNVVARDTSNMDIDGVINADEWGTPMYTTNHGNVTIGNDSLYRALNYSANVAATNDLLSTCNYYWTWDAENMYVAWDIYFPDHVDTRTMRADLTMDVGGDKTYQYLIGLHKTNGKTGIWGDLVGGNFTDTLTGTKDDPNAVIIYGYNWGTEGQKDHVTIELKIPLSRIKAKTTYDFTAGRYPVVLGYVDYGSKTIINRTHPYNGYKDILNFVPTQAADLTDTEVTVTAVTSNSVSLSFAKAGNYTYRVGDTGAYTQIAAQANTSVTISGLTPTDTISIWAVGDGLAVAPADNPITVSMEDIAAPVLNTDVSFEVTGDGTGDLTFTTAGTYLYQVGTNDAVEVTVSGSSVVVPLTSLSGETDILVTKKIGDETVANSAALLIDLIAVDAPTGLDRTHETAMYAQDGTITGVTSAMEWRAEGETTYETCPDGTITNLKPGTYYVRVKANGTAFASADVAIIIVTGEPIPIAVEIDVTSTHKTTYAIGDTLDVTGLKLLVYMNDGNKKVVDATAAMVSGFDSSAIYMAQPLTITYTENGVTVTTTYDVTIVEEILTQEEINFQNYIWLMYIMYNQKYDISAAATEGGSISDAGVTKVKYGNSQTYTVTANDGYKLKSLIVDGVDMGAITTYTFEKVKTDHTISAVFEKTAPAVTYTDVKANDWFYADVMAVYELGLMNGTGNNAFDPDETLTRATLVTALWRLAGEPAADASDFTDVKAGEWYTAAVNWAAANNIVNGFDGKFNPEDPITREQVMAILHRFADLMNYESKAGVDGDYTVSDWAKADVAWANGNGILDGIGVDISDMTDEADRAEIAAYLARFAKAFVK